jgi:hypothetical protein
LWTSFDDNLLAKAHVQGRATNIIPVNIDCGSSVKKTICTHVTLHKTALFTVFILGGLAFIAFGGFPHEQRAVQVDTLHLRAFIVHLRFGGNLKVILIKFA